MCYNGFEETMVSMNYLVIPVRSFINDLALMEQCIITGKHTPLCSATKSHLKTGEYIQQSASQTPFMFLPTSF